MDIKVKQLYDISKIVVPQEMTKWKVTDDQIEEQLKTIAKLSAVETDGDVAAVDDCVVLSCEEGALAGRTVLLYPGLNLPGAEAAEQAVLGLSIGSELTVELNGEVKLKVEKILRRVPVAIDDELIKAQAIEGIATVDAYREWYRKKAGMENREQALKMIKSYYLDCLAEKSEFDYDHAELDAWVDEGIQQQIMYMAEVTGQPAEISEEEIAEMKRKGRLMPLRAVVEQEICQSQGFTFTQDMFEDEIKAMADEMPGMEDMLDDYRDMYVSNAYMDKASELLDECAQSCLEVE